uniref:ATP synthase subunit b n=1 Tax=Meloidogyne hapla TaxID=6305 RepID=A0A1I8C0Y7_MELHA
MLDKILFSKRTLLINVLIRNASTIAPVEQKSEKKGLSYYLDFFNDTKPLDQSGTILANIGKKMHHDPLPSVPKDFKEFPERDLINFPYPEMMMYPAKTRFLLIPDSWLRPIEKVTGTSDKVEQHYYKFFKNLMDTRKEFIKGELKEANDFRKYAKEQTESLNAVQENFPTILRENLSLQLESTYRKNAEYAWIELKRRLDYLKEVQETKERFAKEMHLKTITEGVRKMIEKNEGNIREKYMDQCIENLKLLTK